MRQIYIMKKAEDIHEAIRGLPPCHHVLPEKHQ